MLETLDVAIEPARAQVVRIVGSSDEEVTVNQIPFTPRAKKVLELSLREALSLGHNYIGPEHILLGLLRENDGVALQILLDFDVDEEKLRNEVIRMLSGAHAPPRAEPPTKDWRGPWQTIDSGWLDGLDTVVNQLAEEIRRGLVREPDAGDLLLALAVAPQTLAAQALQQLGIDLDAPSATIERTRPQVPKAQDELARRIKEVSVEKKRAIEAQQFETASRLRDQERELTQQKRARMTTSTEALEAIHRRLGLPAPPNPSTTTIR